MYIPQHVILISVYDAIIVSKRERNTLTSFNKKV